uniref:Uncharacterized protein n=1 Tax=Setaria viridis TaxID=4556 RepID=A0A4U6U2V1_SETVI|nr:hypothetical protein SEVIR_6G129000v2 [Setaria viridis]
MRPDEGFIDLVRNLCADLLFFVFVALTRGHFVFVGHADPGCGLAPAAGAQKGAAGVVRLYGADRGPARGERRGPRGGAIGRGRGRGPRSTFCFFGRPFGAERRSPGPFGRGGDRPRRRRGGGNGGDGNRDGCPCSRDGDGGSARGERACLRGRGGGGGGDGGGDLRPGGPSGGGTDGGGGGARSRGSGRGGGASLGGCGGGRGGRGDTCAAACVGGDGAVGRARGSPDGDRCAGAGTVGEPGGFRDDGACFDGGVGIGSRLGLGRYRSQGVERVCPALDVPWSGGSGSASTWRGSGPGS